MRERLIKFIATGFGTGNLPVAPGTMGSFLGVGYWWVLRHADAWVYWLGFGIGVAIAVWCAGAASEIYRRPDPPSVVLDEIAAVPLALAGLGAHVWTIITAFFLFRLFDIWKPPPLRQVQAFSGGVGIVLDDLLAAAYACASTHAIVWVVNWSRHRFW